MNPHPYDDHQWHPCGEGSGALAWCVTAILGVCLFGLLMWWSS
jgi:glyoxylate carboligase